MEPMELNAGRFHLRPLRRDGRVDDGPALATVHGRVITDEYFEDAAADWAADRAYRWAVAEQTRVDLVAEVMVTPVGDEEAEIRVIGGGAPDTVLPGDDPTLDPVTIADACAAAKETASRWAGDALGRTPVTPRPFPGHPGRARPADD